ncbi:MAG TPA: carbohydrate porin [Terriglobia bacterium]|nr:carbohydrate porin [Terriglobia bacterium]
MAWLKSVTWKMAGVSLFLATLGAGPRAVFAQDSSEMNAQDSGATQPGEATTVLDHPSTGRWWISGQANFIFQWHSSFPAKYTGVNSLDPESESALSNLLTLYTGYQLNNSTEFLLDVESAGGSGISKALGLAGFTNLDVVRSPDLGQTPYLARLMLHKIIALGHQGAPAQRGLLSLATQLPARRLEFRIGKFSLVDFFDVNSVGSDSHLQFMNWTDDNNGAYDYAANTRGYTWGALVEYQSPGWGARYAETLEPKIANGPNLDADLFRAHAENFEVEFRRNFLPRRQGTVRLCSFINHANMGSYRQAIADFRHGLTPVPDVVATRQQGRVKYGFGLNLEQPITDTLRAFGRFGWNEGHHESFAYTEVDQSASLGADWRGDRWRRKLDKMGLAFMANAISGDHRQYLALGGVGFLLGDGKLTYGREKIVEGYYTVHLWRGVFASADIQHINNPGYNRDRGPVLVPGLRAHVDF